MTLLEVLQRPAAAETLTTERWIGLIAAARHGHLLPRLSLLLERQPFFQALPEKVRQQLVAARPLAAQHERIIRWEVARIREALASIDTKIVLLKGAAYVMSGVPAGSGRLASDVDIMVPRRDLEDVEKALLAAGWRAVKLHPYDQRFYRQWSHELPPLQHERRKSVVDVHHNILPRTGRIHPDAKALLDAAAPLERAPGLKTRPPFGDLWTLGPEDMVLHNAAHLFQDGDLAGSVRDLVDADALLRDFGARAPGFWNRLAPRARHHDLERPLFYTLRFAQRLLGTPVPPAVVAALARPPAVTVAVMDRLVARALLPITGARSTFGEETARTLLYARSHWLRMPPAQLAVHLTRKAMRRWTDDEKP